MPCTTAPAPLTCVLIHILTHVLLHMYPHTYSHAHTASHIFFSHVQPHAEQFSSCAPDDTARTWDLDIEAAFEVTGLGPLRGLAIITLPELLVQQKLALSLQPGKSVAQLGVRIDPVSYGSAGDTAGPGLSLAPHSPQSAAGVVLFPKARKKVLSGGEGGESKSSHWF